MSSGQAAQVERTLSPDQSSHASNAYDSIACESELDDDDDMDFEPAIDDNEDSELLDADGGGDDFHGMSHGFPSPQVKRSGSEG